MKTWKANLICLLTAAALTPSAFACKADDGDLLASQGISRCDGRLLVRLEPDHEQREVRVEWTSIDTGLKQVSVVKGEVSSRAVARDLCHPNSIDTHPDSEVIDCEI